MSRRKKISKIHGKIMVSIYKIKILSAFIQYNTDSKKDIMTLAGIICEKSSCISGENEKLGILFEL